MKNLRSLSAIRWALLLFISVAVISCSKDSSDDDPKPDAATGVEGSWNISAITISPSLNGVTDLLAFLNKSLGNDCLSRITFIFKAGGAIDGTVPTGCQDLADDNDIVDDKSTWKVVGNKIQLTDGTEVTEYDLAVSKTEMKWSVDEVEDGTTYKTTIIFTRK